MLWKLVAFRQTKNQSHSEVSSFQLKAFHKKCFTCLDCKRPLDSTLCCDTPDGEIICKLCYGKNYGPKGYGYGGGAGTLQCADL